VSESEEAAERIRMLRVPLSEQLSKILEITRASVHGASNSALNELENVWADQLLEQAPETPAEPRREIRATLKEIGKRFSGFEGTARDLEGRAERLLQEMAQLESWSKTDADRRLVEAQTAREELAGFPMRESAKFLLTVGAALFGLGSGTVTFVQATAPRAISPFGSNLQTFAIAALYLAGLVFVLVGIGMMRDDERDKLATYHFLFGGAKYPPRGMGQLAPNPAVETSK
jgi:hypothetical protein